MGIFTSKCPHCQADIVWFLEAPVDYVCRCGKSVSQEEIEKSGGDEYAKTLFNNTCEWVNRSTMSRLDIIETLAILDRHMGQVQEGFLSLIDLGGFCSAMNHATAYRNKTYLEAAKEYSKIGDES